MLQELNMYPSRNTWAKYVDCFLGFYNVWLNQGVENETLFF